MAIYRGLGGSGTTSDTAALDEITINAQEAAQSATDAASSASASATSATNSANSATASATSASESADSAAAALVSEVNAAASENAAATSETNAATSETNAATSAANAAASETAAASSATDAQTAQTAAEAAQTAAENAQAATETLFDQFGDQYLGSLASDPTVDNDGDPLNEGDVYWNSTDNVLKFYSGTAWVAPEDIATTAATNASNSASAAATSESNAATSATNAETSYQNTLAIYGDTQDVANAVAAAQSAQTGAETAETNAGNSALAANTSANDAATSEANAAASETAAAGSAASASTSATASANSATAASASATAAATSETNAATSATNAATSATASANSATASAASATSAANSAAAAAASLDNFDDRYLGAKASDPTLDNDGNPLVTGALYFNTTDTVMKIWEGTMWIAAASAQLAAFAKFAYTATAGQTVFSGSDDNANTLALTVDTEIVMLNGVVLEQDTDYTATATSITLTSGAASGDELNVFAFGSFQVADTVSKSLGGTFTGAVSFDGGVVSNGRVGVNISSPAFDLHVVGDAQVTKTAAGTQQVLQLNNSDTSAGTQAVKLGFSSQGITKASINSAVYNNDYMAFNVGSDTERMRIDANGNVGIGTSSPSAKLQIATPGSGGQPYSASFYSNNGGTGATGLSPYGITIGGNVSGGDAETNIVYGSAGAGLDFNSFDGTTITKRMRIDSAGRVTMPYQPSFSVSYDGGTVADATNIPWNTSSGGGRHNTGNHFNTSTGVFTAPVGGKYLFNVQVHHASGSGTPGSHHYFDVTVNGGGATRFIGRWTFDDWYELDHSVILNLAANDQVAILVNRAQGQWMGQSRSDHNRFSGHLLA